MLIVVALGGNAVSLPGKEGNIADQFAATRAVCVPMADLILAGHSHGGQVRLPFIGPLLLPSGVGPYDYGCYDTPGGPLSVSAGIGTLSSFPIRWNCPPEITLVTI